MIIGIDAGNLGVTDERLKTGIYNFTRNLLVALSRIDKTNSYLLYSFKPLEQNLLHSLGLNYQNRVVKLSKFWLSFSLSVRILLDKPDVFIGLNQALPLVLPKKSIVFVHDLAYEIYPQKYQDSYLKIKYLTKFATSRAYRIVAVSENTKNDLINKYKISADKIKVIYHGVSSFFKPQNDLKVSPLLKKYKINKPYILYVGSLKKLKNLPNQIKAFSRFQLISKKSFQLILAGSDFWIDNEINHEFNNLPEKTRISMLGFVPLNDLPGLYSGAECLLSASYYEGFGLPVIESLACGTPVVVGNKGAMTEVGGKMVFGCDPDDIEDISANIIRATGSKNTAFRKKAVEYSARFNWTQSAEKLLDIINK